MVLGLFTFDEELKQQLPQYQGKPTDSTPFGLSSDDDDDSSTDGMHIITITLNCHLRP